MDQMIGETSLHVWDIHLQEAYQRKGVGRHLLTLLELIARRERIKMISVPVQLGDDRTAQWINKVGRYVPDESLVRLVGFDPDMEVRTDEHTRAENCRRTYYHSISIAIYLIRLD
jgi:GNAT superfamily N-acetyltransferase